MSVDERLREAFGGEDSTWDERRMPVLEAVHAGVRRRTVTRRVVVGGLVAASVAVAAVVWGAVAGGDKAAPPVVHSPSETVTVSAPLEGRWTSASVTTAGLRATLRAAGRDAWFDELLPNLPARPTVYSLRLTGGSAELIARGHNESLQVMDQQTYAVDGDHLVLTTSFGSGSTTYRWSIDGDQLHLEFLSTTEPSSGGIPREVYQRALYTAVPFNRD